MKKKNIKTFLKKCIGTIHFSFIMIYIISKMLVLLKNPLNYLKHIIFECFFEKNNKLLFSFLKILFFHNVMKDLRPEEENIIKDIVNLFRLKKN